MATFTAQVLIGHSHRYHDGILPTHAIMVSENSRAALVLKPFHVYEDEEPSAETASPRTVFWIPNPDHIVDDLVLQICLHVLHEPGVIAQTETIYKGLSEAQHAELVKLPAADRAALSAACLEVKGFPKLVVTLLGGSLLTRNITRFGDYSMDIEVCTVAYQRQYSEWKQEAFISGSLDKIQAF